MMRRGFYQVLLVIFLVGGPLMIAADVMAMWSLMPIHPEAKAVFFILGILLQPVAAIGLWYDRMWGAVLLVVATVLCVFTAFGCAIGGLLMLPLVTIRLLAVKRDRAGMVSHQDRSLPTEQ